MKAPNTRIVPAKSDNQTVAELNAVSEILRDHPGIKPKWAKKGVILYGDDDKIFKEPDFKELFDNVWQELEAEDSHFITASINWTTVYATLESDYGPLTEIKHWG